jgi:hypothetical protein
MFAAFVVVTAITIVVTAAFPGTYLALAAAAGVLAAAAH